MESVEESYKQLFAFHDNGTPLFRGGGESHSFGSGPILLADDGPNLREHSKSQRVGNTRGSRVGVVVGVDYDCVCPPLYSRVHFRTAHARHHRANNSAEILISARNVGVNSEIELINEIGGCPMWAGWAGTLRL